MASWTAVGAAAILTQEVLGPDTAVPIGIAVNSSLLLGAAYLIFKAGGTFREWIGVITSATEQSSDLTRLERKTELVLSQLDELQATIIEHGARIIELEEKDEN